MLRMEEYVIEIFIMKYVLGKYVCEKNEDSESALVKGFRLCCCLSVARFFFRGVGGRGVCCGFIFYFVTF